jgi:hypothetical protein
MKLFFFFFSFFCSSYSYGQINTKYKFRYRVETTPLDSGELSFEFKKMLDSETSTDTIVSMKGVIIDEKGEPIIGITVDLGNKKNGNYVCKTNSEGKFSFILPKATYFLKVYGGRIKNVARKNISIIQNTILKIYYNNITSLPNAFGIYSRKKLSKNEIRKIKKCIEINKGFGNCNNNNTFFLTLEI